MPKCKICGEAVQSGEVMHVECREMWEKELMARAEVIREREETIREREQELDMREFELDIREGFVEQWYAEVLETEKKAKRMLAINLAIAAFNVVTALMVIFIR